MFKGNKFLKVFVKLSMFLPIAVRNKDHIVISLLLASQNLAKGRQERFVGFLRIKNKNRLFTKLKMGGVENLTYPSVILNVLPRPMRGTASFQDVLITDF